MAISKELRLKVESELRLGKTSRELASKYKLPYPTIQAWKNKLSHEPEEDAIVDLVVVDPQTLTMVAESLKEQAPKEVAKKIDKLVDGVVGLQKIDEKFRTVVYELLEWAELQTKKEDLSIKEWQIISQCIGNLYSSVFSKNITNVNVMNNTTIDTEKRAIFKSSLGA